MASIPERSPDPKHADEEAWLSARMEEAISLLQQRGHCHDTHNDMMALEWLEALWRRGFPLETEAAEACLLRMRIAVERGSYPREMLQSKNASDG